MFFEQESIPFEIVNVFFFDQTGVKTKCTNRNYHAVALRLEAETVIKTAGMHTELSGGALSFMPAGVDYERISKKDKFLVVDFCSVGSEFEEMEYFYPADIGKYRVLFERVYRIWTEKKTGYRHMAASAFCEILAEAYRERNTSAYLESKIYPSVKYIEKNCMKSDFSLLKAAEASYMSDVYFRRIFKNEFGISPKKYVINKRMEYAKSLIESGYYSLKETAYMCGYSDYKYFSVEFKKATGKSPSEYV